ncbi:MAG TPA: peptide chain release factor N(5)-glutamine methyltransferase [Rheinheimera sp.]|nr:peptide chain release factor N(5)-glutamine methyltransferase [Rheinheimera sp.]
MLLREWLQHAIHQLQPLAVTNPHATDLTFEAQRLWADVLDHSPAAYLAYASQQLSDDDTRQLNQALQRRAAGEPLAYITGRWWFWDLELEVAPCTLIPRPDTEMLVETALQLDVPRHAKVLDLGTGTGAIALVLSREQPRWHVTAVDVNADAVALAKRNQQRYQVANLTILQSDWYQALAGQVFDLIVSNPPYIDGGAPELQVGDVQFEPKSALVADDAGLADIRQILLGCQQHLAQGGWLLVEHGYDQAQSVQQLFAAAGFQRIRTVTDFGQQPRLTLGQKS